jgi:hypothetical protein
MKEPLTIRTTTEPCIHSAGNNKQNLPEIGRKKDNCSISFYNLLKTRIKDIGSEADLYQTEYPLGKEQLQQLIEILQIQMNNYLFNALSDGDEDNELSGFQVDALNFPGIGNQAEPFVSKNEHALQETEAIQPQTHIANIIDRASKKYHIDPELIKAVIRVESNFDANSTSPKGAMGLMQLMPETAEELGVKNCYDPVENIMAGTSYLKNLLDRYDGSVSLALAAYNWGMGNVERHPEKLPRETRTYIARVNNLLYKEML